MKKLTLDARFIAVAQASINYLEQRTSITWKHVGRTLQVLNTLIALPALLFTLISLLLLTLDFLYTYEPAVMMRVALLALVVSFVMMLKSQFKIYFLSKKIFKQGQCFIGPTEEIVTRNKERLGSLCSALAFLILIPYFNFVVINVNGKIAMILVNSYLALLFTGSTVVTLIEYLMCTTPSCLTKKK